MNKSASMIFAAAIVAASTSSLSANSNGGYEMEIHDNKQCFSEDRFQDEMVGPLKLKPTVIEDVDMSANAANLLEVGNEDGIAELRYFEPSLQRVFESEVTGNLYTILEGNLEQRQGEGFNDNDADVTWSCHTATAKPIGLEWL